MVVPLVLTLRPLSFSLLLRSGVIPQPLVLHERVRVLRGGEGRLLRRLHAVRGLLVVMMMTMMMLVLLLVIVLLVHSCSL